MLTKVRAGNVSSDRKVRKFKALWVWLHIDKILFNT